MRESGGTTSHPWDPERYRHEAQSPADTLPEGDLVFSLRDTVPRLAWQRFSAPSEKDTRGAPPFDPAMMVCLWLEAYGVGVFASRKRAWACERPLACMAMVGQERPACRTISDGRQQHLEACKAVWVPVVRMAGDAGLVPWGHVSTEGTKIPGHAARHQARRSGDRKKAVERVREAIEALVTQAYQQAAAAWGRRRGAAVPTERARRADRLATIEAAMPRRASAPCRGGSGTPTDGHASSRPSATPRGGSPRGHGPDALDRSRTAQHAPQAHRLGCLWHGPSACGRDWSAHRGL
jgi:hypothetical protein